MSEQVREEEEVDGGGEDTTLLGYWSNPEAEVNYMYFVLCTVIHTDVNHMTLYILCIIRIKQRLTLTTCVCMFLQ